MEFVDNVFINCPFDDEYKHLFNAKIFTSIDCGFTPRCAREEDDGGQVRIDKLNKIIEDCRFGIHDISRTELDRLNGLPRFNMPFELGIWLGCKTYSNEPRQNRKKTLILDREQYRYQMFLSDIAGQDIRAHDNSVDSIIRNVRNWLRTSSQRTVVPDASAIIRRYNRFLNDLPLICNELELEPADLIFVDYVHVITLWFEKQNGAE